MSYSLYSLCRKKKDRKLMIDVKDATKNKKKGCFCHMAFKMMSSKQSVQCKKRTTPTARHTTKVIWLPAAPSCRFRFMQPGLLKVT